MNCPWCNSSDLRDYNETGGSVFCNNCRQIMNKDFLLKKKIKSDEKVELLPCPFCGFSHSLSPRSNQWQNGLWVYQCGRCGANSPPTSIKDELNKIWNTRYDSTK
jgi:transcription elongation factor Elf1